MAHGSAGLHRPCTRAKIPVEAAGPLHWKCVPWRCRGTGVFLTQFSSFPPSEAGVSEPPEADPHPAVDGRPRTKSE